MRGTQITFTITDAKYYKHLMQESKVVAARKRFNKGLKFLHSLSSVIDHKL